MPPGADTAVRFPDRSRPENSRFLARNELRIDAPPERVWAWLARPDLWPSYYRNARLVRHLEGPWPEIELGSRWRWLTFGALITSELVECEPHARLAWDASGLGARGHHGWVLEPLDGGTRVVTEETQRGWGIALVKPALRPMMLRQHQRWLEGLARVAAESPPPAP
jgi:uncharacterized protein YndB with AHSA1/START domain